MRRPTTAIVVSLASVVALPPPAAAAEPAPAVLWGAEAGGVRGVRNVTYATPGGAAVKLDLFTPIGPGPFPVVLCFHGGAWRFGDKDDVEGFARKLAEHGYAAAAVGYRLAPKHKFPAQIEDAKTAVRFLRSNAKRYDLDPDRVAALGFSAGGHLSALLGTTDAAAGLDGPLFPGVSSRVNCVIDFFGPADLSLYAEAEGLVDAYMVPFLGPKCKTDPTLYKRASPLDYVTKDAAPTLVFHGTADVVVPIVHSERFVDALKKAGVPAELVVVKGEGHGWGGDASKETAKKAKAFLDTHLKGK